jgi:CheY-like chemotaxis protein
MDVAIKDGVIAAIEPKLEGNAKKNVDVTGLIVTPGLIDNQTPVCLTAHAMEEDRQKALAAGADDFDTKPVNLAGLLEKIEKQLNG